MMHLKSPNRSQASSDKPSGCHAHPQQTAPPWVSECLCSPRNQDEFRQNRKAVSQIKPIKGDTAHRDDDNQGVASPGVPDVDVGVHRAGDQNLGLKPGPVQVTEDTHSSSCP